jgi:hypothetical protein
MCFHISKKFPKAMNAEEDIPCWKEVASRSGLRSPRTFKSYFQDFEYAAGGTYDIGGAIGLTPYGDEIEEGFHSFSSLAKVRSQMDSSPYSVIIECFIPKGAEYYYNPRQEEYVSTSIRIGNIVN